MHFLEISRKFEDTGVETVSRNLTLTQRKSTSGPTHTALRSHGNLANCATDESILRSGSWVPLIYHIPIPGLGRRPSYLSTYGCNAKIHKAHHPILPEDPCRSWIWPVRPDVVTHLTMDTFVSLLRHPLHDDGVCRHQAAHVTCHVAKEPKLLSLIIAPLPHLFDNKRPWGHAARRHSRRCCPERRQPARRSHKPQHLANRQHARGRREQERDR